MYFCTLNLYIISCIMAFSVSSILIPDAVERLYTSNIINKINKKHTQIE